MTKIIADTGPLVAYCLRRDQYHLWAVEMLGMLLPPLYTCEPVLTEVFWRVRQQGGDVDLLWDWLEQRVVRLDFEIARHLPDLRNLMRRYLDQPMDFADACVVKMSELVSDCHVFTCDSDFKVYRRKERLRKHRCDRDRSVGRSTTRVDTLHDTGPMDRSAHRHCSPGSGGLRGHLPGGVKHG